MPSTTSGTGQITGCRSCGGFTRPTTPLQPWTKHIESRVTAEGVIHMEDRATGETLALRFVKIHDPVRVIDQQTYFACTDFHVVGEPDKVYDLDFWLHPAGDVLEVYEERVHKEPRRSLLWGWYKHPRYTFVDDEVVSLY